MKMTFVFAIGLGLIAFTHRQSREEHPERLKESVRISHCQDVPREIIESLWGMAARGELLTSKGWAEASALFTRPGSATGNKVIRIVSEYYAANPSSIDGRNATVDVGFLEAGQIDAALRYSAPAPMPPMVLHSSQRYHLVSRPAYVMMYGPDGKTPVDKKEIPGEVVWQVDGPPPAPWITVNAAIRYVLEKRDKTTDPAIRKNADQTLAKLKTLH